MGVKQIDPAQPVLPASTAVERSLSVYGYTDFRTYLRDYYEFRKDGQHDYSFRAFSKTAGFSSPNILKLMIDGERNISPEATQKFCKGLNLTGQMAEYFATLVRMNQAKNVMLRNVQSPLLWKLSGLYREALNALGVQVPAILPRDSR